ncbi:IS5 family transposase [Hymenobacter sp. PAMC 26628]|uniref:IS5 family transposase n=1 Tax=Hymenobacter sp. PAMC 26628 TaxID=1484118 RepID=UPI00194FF5BD|nr:IS5 family transposase [Hymenobacter sp. PAMC 26628]
MATVQEFTISDTLWARLAPLLPAHVGKAHPLGCHRPRIPDRDARSAIFFVLRTGCQWKALDATGLCQSSTAHSRFQQWVQAGVFARRWDEALGDYDELLGLNFAWMALDGSLHKAPLGGKKTGPNPPDRGNGGVKRSLLTEARGIPVGLVLDGANRHDGKLVESTWASVPPQAEAARDAHRAAGGQQGLCLAAGYASKQVRELLAALGYTAHIRPRGEEVQAKKAGQKARRWAVERTHSWRNRFRHLLIRWAKKPENYLAMLHFACARITWSNCLFG